MTINTFQKVSFDKLQADVTELLLVLQQDPQWSFHRKKEILLDIKSALAHFLTISEHRADMRFQKRTEHVERDNATLKQIWEDDEHKRKQAHKKTKIEKYFSDILQSVMQAKQNALKSGIDSVDTVFGKAKPSDAELLQDFQSNPLELYPLPNKTAHTDTYKQQLHDRILNWKFSGTKKLDINDLEQSIDAQLAYAQENNIYNNYSTLAELFASINITIPTHSLQLFVPVTWAKSKVHTHSDTETPERRIGEYKKIGMLFKLFNDNNISIDPNDMILYQDGILHLYIQSCNKTIIISDTMQKNGNYETFTDATFIIQWRLQMRDIMWGINKNDLGKYCGVRLVFTTKDLWTENIIDNLNRMLTTPLKDNGHESSDKLLLENTPAAAITPTQTIEPETSSIGIIKHKDILLQHIHMHIGSDIGYDSWANHARAWNLNPNRNYDLYTSIYEFIPLLGWNPVILHIGYVRALIAGDLTKASEIEKDYDFISKNSYTNNTDTLWHLKEAFKNFTLTDYTADSAYVKLINKQLSAYQDIITKLIDEEGHSLITARKHVALEKLHLPLDPRTLRGWLGWLRFIGKGDYTRHLMRKFLLEQEGKQTSDLYKQVTQYIQESEITSGIRLKRKETPAVIQKEQPTIAHTGNNLPWLTIKGKVDIDDPKKFRKRGLDKNPLIKDQRPQSDPIQLSKKLERRDKEKDFVTKHNLIGTTFDTITKGARITWLFVNFDTKNDKILFCIWWDTGNHVYAFAFRTPALETLTRYSEVQLKVIEKYPSSKHIKVIVEKK